MPPITGTARLEDIQPLNDRYAHLYFELEQPHQLPFLSGQYLSIKVSPQGERRSYSLCSTPATDHGFELLIDYAPDGIGSRYLKDLKFGDTIEFIGPMGRFVLADQKEPEIVLIATGSGVAPYRSMILDLLQLKQDARQITLLWGMRYQEQLFWQDELVELAENFSNFTFHPVISQATPEWQLCRGRVTDCLWGHTFEWLKLPLLSQTGFYLCGNTDMITATTQLLQDKGVNPTQIHTEKFY